MYSKPSEPPKNYGKKHRRSLGLFIMRPSGICLEMARVKITTRGEIYQIYPILRNLDLDFHESFHKSGEFHWKITGLRIYPISGALDLPMAMRFYLYANAPPCMCIRCDNLRLSKREIAEGLRVLLRLVPIDVEPSIINEYAEILKERGFIRFVRTPWTISELLYPHTLLMSWNPRQHIEAVRRLLEGTKFEKHVISLKEVVKRGKG